MGTAQMRDFSEFCEQLNEIRLKFNKWDTCEKTVGLYYLMIGLPFANARFLQHALEQCIISANTLESQVFERNANDSVFVGSFSSERPQIALSLLLSHLPLLKPGNKEATECYLKTIRHILTEFITPPSKIYNECVEVMSYIYIHPAFSNDDKKSFKHLLKQILSKVTPQNFVGSTTDSSDESSISPNPDSRQNLPISRSDRRSNSLTPAQSSSQENINPCKESLYSRESLVPPPKPRSYSLSSEKSSLDGITNLHLSSSETRLQDLQLMNNLPAMKSIVSWLKSLRLHKYSWVFNNLTYSQMLNLTEETLHGIGITKGARHKILLSIKKLRERSTMLSELETEVMNGGDLGIALKKLKGVLQSPLQISSGEDLSSQFVKVMGKVCTQLLMLRQPSDDYIMSFGSLCERAEPLDAFTEEQKKRLNMWKSQLMEGEDLKLYKCQEKYSTRNRPQIGPHFTSSPSESTGAQKSSSYPNMKNNVIPNAHRHSVGSITLKNHLFSMPRPQNTLKSNVAGYSDCTKTFPESDVDPPSSKLRNYNFKQEYSLRNTDIESSLESLCLQMMEHALGP